MIRQAQLNSPFSLASEYSLAAARAEFNRKAETEIFARKRFNPEKMSSRIPATENEVESLSNKVIVGPLAADARPLPKLLNGIRLRRAPFTYSFCNLELQGVAAYSRPQAEPAIFGPRRASNI
jgi:hypothetical protein